MMRTPILPVLLRVLRGMPGAAALLALLLFAGVPGARAQTGGDVETRGSTEARTLQETFIHIAESVAQAVVHIRTEGTARHPRISRGPRDPRLPLEDIPRRGFGSGIIFDARGYILTNHHVIEGSDRVFVTLADGREFVAGVVGADKRTDLAVLRIPAGGRLSTARFGDSDRLHRGQWTMAIGHPFGLERSVTVGVVSGIGRNGMGITQYENFIQTDASINPGNSGGPLINLDGEVIGVNTAIVPRAGGGIGFAIPINMAKRVARALIKDGRIVRGFLGVMIQPLSRDMARKFGLERPEGALIADVLEGGASERAGVRRGDVVLRFNGSRVRNVPELQRLAAFAAPGTRVVLEVQRAGRRVSLPLVMGRLQDASAAPRRSRPASAKSPYGLTVDDLSQEMLEDLARRGVKGGVHVTGVLPNSRAAADGLRVGDVIAEVENRPVADETSFREALQDGPRDVLVLIYRTGRSLFRVLHAPR